MTRTATGSSFSRPESANNPDYRPGSATELTRPLENWAEFGRSLAGQLFVPRSEGYEEARRPFNARFDSLRPEAVAQCADSQDVVEAVRFAANKGIEVAVRCGGHSLAGLSSTRGLLIDVSPMRSITVTKGLVHVGAGIRLGSMYEQLLDHGLTIPAGTCPSVGIAGLTLGGGFGLLGRRYGLTLDRLESATVVLADGSIVECDDSRDAPLFWALRGAGAGKFGVVTRFTFRPVMASSTMSAFALTWPFAHAAEVLTAWQISAPNAADDFYAEMELSAGENILDTPSVAVRGAGLASERDTRRLLDAMVDVVGLAPSSYNCGELSFRETIALHAGEGGEVSHQAFHFAKSEFFDKPLPDSTALALIATFEQSRRPGQSRTLYFAPWGGAINRRAADATAFAHRDHLFLIEHSALVDRGAKQADKAAADDWVKSSWASVHDAGSGSVYPAFPDPQLVNAESAYYAGNVARIREVKAMYDPDNFFG